MPMNIQQTARAVLCVILGAGISVNASARQPAPPAPQPPAPQPPVPAVPGGTFDPARPVTAEVDTSTLARISIDPRLTDFTSLVMATQQESLLRSEAVTLLVPTNDALAALGPGAVERLLKPENIDEVRQLVRSHVLLQVLPANKLTTSGRLRTFGGRRILPTLADGRISIGNARLIQFDITASNGVVHIIDGVITGPTRSLLESVEADPSLSRFAQMLKLTGVDVSLAGKQNLTVLAPSDAAFARLNPKVVSDLMDPNNRTELSKLVARHVFAGSIYSESLGTIAAGQRGIPSLAGDPLHSEMKDGNPLFNKTARLTKTDTEASNGVLHTIDDVLRFIPWGEQAPKVPDQNIPIPSVPAPK